MNEFLHNSVFAVSNVIGTSADIPPLNYKVAQIILYLLASLLLVSGLWFMIRDIFLQKPLENQNSETQRGSTIKTILKLAPYTFFGFGAIAVVTIVLSICSHFNTQCATFNYVWESILRGQAVTNT